MVNFRSGAWCCALPYPWGGKMPGSFCLTGTYSGRAELLMGRGRPWPASGHVNAGMSTFTGEPSPSTPTIRHWRHYQQLGSGRKPLRLLLWADRLNQYNFRLEFMSGHADIVSCQVLLRWQRRQPPTERTTKTGSTFCMHPSARWSPWLSWIKPQVMTTFLRPSVPTFRMAGHNTHKNGICACREEGKIFGDVLNLTHLTMRASKHSTTGVSPALLMIGRKLTRCTVQGPGSGSNTPTTRISFSHPGQSPLRSLRSWDHPLTDWKMGLNGTQTARTELQPP